MRDTSKATPAAEWTAKVRQSMEAIVEVDLRLRRDTTVGRYNVRFTPKQKLMIETYLSTGRLRAQSGRGAGKSFVLAYLAALELEAGHTVCYRAGIGNTPIARDALRNTLSRFLGNKVVQEAERSRNLILPVNRDDYHYFISRTVDADLRDEPWLGGYFHVMKSVRFAEVGSLPEGTLMLDAEKPVDNPVWAFTPSHVWWLAGNKFYNNTSAGVPAPPASSGGSIVSTPKSICADVSAPESPCAATDETEFAPCAIMGPHGRLDVS